MPAYKATVVGENFEFVVDDEKQYLDFYRTLYLNADDEHSAGQHALQAVIAELRAQALLAVNDDPDQYITLSAIEPHAQSDANIIAGDFVWYFPEEEYDWSEEDDEE